MSFVLRIFRAAQAATVSPCSQFTQPRTCGRISQMRLIAVDFMGAVQ